MDNKECDRRISRLENEILEIKEIFEIEEKQIEEIKQESKKHLIKINVFRMITILGVIGSIYEKNYTNAIYFSALYFLTKNLGKVVVK